MLEPINKITYKDQYYHIYNRGYQKQNIFIEESDYIKFLEAVRKYKDMYNISVICYCFMSNHIHLLLRQNTQVPILRMMQQASSLYSRYFNMKYDKSGHLFQGRYRFKHIANEAYLQQVAAYIHLNPVYDFVADKPEEYQWSSYQDYINQRSGTLCEKDVVLVGQNGQDYHKDISDLRMDFIKLSKIKRDYEF